MRDRHVTHLLTRYVHGQLPPAARARVVNHVRTCATCRAALAREERMAADLRRELPVVASASAGQMAQIWAGVWREIGAPGQGHHPALARVPGVSVVLAMVLALAVALPLLAGSGLRADAAPLQPRPISTASPTPDAAETGEASPLGIVPLQIAAQQPEATVALAVQVGVTPAPVPLATVSPQARGGVQWR